ncbi:DUF4186 domain-containing protein [Caballeronia sordidicola]|jgi:Domain of unknown function (DUF4186)|uniref:DUF4186 domain-containing protein n=1 Tax=Caballeronia sordidicola TaxID=196367 RepID=A0A226WRR2_CABSO|nr:DUF4186 domain-containing protein [Caballeronia sordidicola]OXC73876.1 hypothetical protein BSU04_33955 [Caballeronia sordidicola]
MRDLDTVFHALQHSNFRMRFRLGVREEAYLREHGMTEVIGHARELITRRLAPGQPPNDGKQTPFRGHPVFIAQHATATCCRSCLAKWHGIEAGKRLDDGERDHVVQAIERWLKSQKVRGADKPPRQPDLPF